MSTNAIITRLKARLEAEKEQQSTSGEYMKGESFSYYMDEIEAYKSGHDSATATLMPILEQAVATLETIADITSAIKYPIRNESYRDYELRNIAREFLASIRDGSER